MNTFLLAIIAFGSAYSVINHAYDELKHYRWRKKIDSKYGNYKQEWTDIV